MAGSGRKNADDVLILALAAGQSIPDAAQSSGVSERTVYRRLEDPLFRQAVQQARGEMVQRAIGKLAGASTKAVDTLEALLTAEGESVRLGAARSILELGSKLRETIEHEERLAALEGRAAHESKPKIAS